MYNVPPEIAGSVTLIKVSLSVQYIQLEQIYKVPEKSERCIIAGIFPLKSEATLRQRGRTENL